MSADGTAALRALVEEGYGNRLVKGVPVCKALASPLGAKRDRLWVVGRTQEFSSPFFVPAKLLITGFLVAAPQTLIPPSYKKRSPISGIPFLIKSPRAELNR